MLKLQAGQGYLNTSSATKAAEYLTALCGDFSVPEAMVKVWDIRKKVQDTKS